MYQKYVKRLLDIILSLIAIILLSPVCLVMIAVGMIKMKGNPFFSQPRPGRIDSITGQEQIYNMIKFRSMTQKKDANGNLLPDERRLTKYGIFIRSTSLDEIPEFFHVLTGKMSLIGPRPQLVRDMVFMTKEERMRHLVRPGITGLAQVNGRNDIEWDVKLDWDVQYVNNLSFVLDVKIFLLTIHKVIHRESISHEGMATAEDYGDWLLRMGKVTDEEYNEKQMLAKVLLM